MLDGKPTIVLSYSGRFQDRVADPVAERLEKHGFRAVRVGEEPLPAHIDSNPNSKVEWFFRHADMAVFLATPDDRLESGEVYTRPNIIDEHRLGQQLPHLHQRLLVFRAREVKLPSNINPVYERLPVDDPDWIVSKIVEQARSWGVLPRPVETEPATAPEQAAAPETSDEPGAGPTVSVDVDGSAADQASEAVRHTVAALNGTAPDRARLRRAELAIAGLNAEAGSADVVGVHLANSLFASRHTIQLRPSERHLLLRTYLSHVRDDNIPGFFWLKELSRDQLTRLLLGVARDDTDAEVRAQALEVLGRLGAPSDVTEARSLANEFLADEEPRLLRAGLAFVAERRDARLRDILDDPDLLRRDRYGVSRTQALIDLRSRPGDVMDRYVEDAYIRDGAVEKALLQASRRVRSAAVLKAIASPVPDVRLLGIQLAAEKQVRSPERARELVERDRSQRARVAAIRWLIAVGEPVDLALFHRAANKREDDVTGSTGIDEDRAIALAVCSRLPFEEVVTAARWESLDGPEAYEALGLRDAEWAEKYVRSDLRTDFKRLTDAGHARLLQDISARAEEKTKRPLNQSEREMVLEAVDKQWEGIASEGKVGAFVRRQFQRAALNVLVAQGRATDIRYAREFAESKDQDLRVAALGLIAKFGKARDAPTALRLADEIYGEEHRQEAAETALRLTYKKDKLDVLRTLRENHSVKMWTVKRLADVTGGVDEAWRLLRADDAVIRLAATSVVWDAVDPAHADTLLTLYMRGQHYYNVVRAVDCRLYAPARLRAPADS